MNEWIFQMVMLPMTLGDP